MKNLVRATNIPDFQKRAQHLVDKYHKLSALPSTKANKMRLSRLKQDWKKLKELEAEKKQKTK